MLNRPSAKPVRERIQTCIEGGSTLTGIGILASVFGILADGGEVLDRAAEKGWWADFERLVSQHPHAMLAFAFGLVVGGVARRGHWLMGALWARRHYAHLEQAAALRAYPYYTELIDVHVPMLGISAREFSKRVGIPLLVARHIMSDGLFVPRPEILHSICRALLVPPDWPACGGGYGFELTKQRLIHYHKRGHASAWTKAQVLRMSHKSRVKILHAVERRLQNDREANHG